MDILYYDRATGRLLPFMDRDIAEVAFAKATASLPANQVGVGRTGDVVVGYAYDGEIYGRQPREWDRLDEEAAAEREAERQRRIDADRAICGAFGIVQIGRRYYPHGWGARCVMDDGRTVDIGPQAIADAAAQEDAALAAVYQALERIVRERP